MPNFMAKITGFVLHYKDWRAAGYPTRSPEWIRELFAICKACPYYEPEGSNPFTKMGLCPKGLCGKCGCHVSDDPENEVNTLLYPTKPCPDDRFDATVNIENNANPNTKAEQ